MDQPAFLPMRVVAAPEDPAVSARGDVPVVDELCLLIGMPRNHANAPLYRRSAATPEAQSLRAALLPDADRRAAADQVSRQHGLARHEPAHLVDADDRAAQPSNVLAG